MTFEELLSLVDEALWFQQLSEPIANRQHRQIPCLDPWAGSSTDDLELQQLHDQMDWLPTSAYQEDPIYGKSLHERAKKLGKKEEYSKRSLDAYRHTLVALRGFSGNSLLKVGPHDFTEAARGAALFACRQAAYETLLGDEGFWCSAMALYQSGHWPCGILPDSNLVVF